MKNIKIYLFFFLCAPLYAENYETILIKNATVMTSMELGILENTDLLINDGLITKIGQNLKHEGATIVDCF